MAHLAFVTPPFLGHVNPMLALAREAVRRGHRATFLHMADAASLVEGRGVEFHPVGLASHPVGRLAAITARTARVDGILGIAGVVRDVAATTRMLVDELPGALRAIGADMLVCDGAEAAGGLVAAHLGLPFVTVANALPLNREPGVPPPFIGWRYDPSDWGSERNLAGYRVSDFLMRRHREVIAEAAARWRLGARETVADCVSPLAEISQTVAGFDFPRKALPATFHHVGPLREARPASDRAAPFSPEPNGARMAYATLGTLQGGRAGLFRRIAAAADALDLSLVLAHGGLLGAREIASLKGRPSVHAFVDQDRVLARADVAIVNGGLNTVMDALARGVPLVVLPIAFEQGATAARVERSGAGIRLSRRFLTARSLARALGPVLDDPAYREAARGLATEIAAAGGVRRAADIVEAVLGTGRPVPRDISTGFQAVPVRAAAAAAPSRA